METSKWQRAKHQKNRQPRKNRQRRKNNFLIIPDYQKAISATALMAFLHFVKVSNL
jgi:hypothetical protein